MKRLVLMVLVAGLLTPAGLYAQKVYKDGSDKVILDFEGLPKGAVTEVKKYTTDDTATDNDWLVDEAYSKAQNKEVYRKLEIAPYDMNNKGEIVETSLNSFTMDWATAYNGCKNSGYDGSGWRLPTQRELQFMWIFKDGLEDNAAQFDAEYYWSATENATRYAWFVSFGSGYTFNYTKSLGSYRVRCVREVAP